MSTLADSQVEQRFVSILGAAVRVGVSPTTIRDWLRAGRLTALRPIGKKVLIDVEQLDGLVLGSAVGRTA
jgi:excisionase family DNA binding protein